MKRLPVLLWGLIVACAASSSDILTGPGGGGGGGFQMNEGSDAGPDAGMEDPSDAGMSCPADPDGTQGGFRVTVSEMFFGSAPFFEIRNGTAQALDLSSLAFDGTITPQLSGGTLAVGASVLASVPASTAGELRISRNGTLDFYVCWGPQGPTTLQNDAITEGLWTTAGACPLLPAADRSLHLRGPGLSFGDWVVAEPTPLGCAP